MNQSSTKKLSVIANKRVHFGSVDLKLIQSRIFFEEKSHRSISGTEIKTGQLKNRNKYFFDNREN